MGVANLAIPRVLVLAVSRLRVDGLVYVFAPLGEHRS